MKQKGICMKRIIYITIACAFLSVSFAKAQVLTLKECLEEGLQNNYSLRIIHNEEQISKNNATLGNAGYLPTLEIQNACWAVPKPLVFCIQWMQAAHF